MSIQAPLPNKGTQSVNCGPVQRLASRCRRPAAGSAVACVILLVACAGCGSGPQQEPVCAELSWDGPRPGTSVVLIVSDTMRRDRMGIHGGRARTPAFDRFAREHLLFERAYTQAPWTKPSMATLFTSLFPSQHGVLANPRVNAAGYFEPGTRPRENDVLSGKLVTLAEFLRSAGYRTAAFVSNPWMIEGFGFEQGFDVYDDSFAAWDAPGETVSEAGLRWLRGLEPDRPFLLYLHYMDSHRPYPALSRWNVLERAADVFADAPELASYVQTTITDVVSLEEGLSLAEAGLRPSLALLDAAYDRGVERFDEALASFLDGFAAHEAYERTAIIVTSDHGEALFARGYDNHGNGLYDDEVAIPFAARLPGVSGPDHRVDCPLGLIDTLPTLCSYLGLECSGPRFGTSLLGGVRSPGERYVFTEGVVDKPGNRAIRDAGYKLILQPQRGYDGTGDLLFDMRADPGETRDLLAVEPRGPEIERAYETLARAAERAVPRFDAPERETAPLDPEQERRLRELGYVDDGP